MRNSTDLPPLLNCILGFHCLHIARTGLFFMTFFRIEGFPLNNLAFMEIFLGVKGKVNNLFFQILSPCKLLMNVARMRIHL